jgi:hypothetical protein
MKGFYKGGWNMKYHDDIDDLQVMLLRLKKEKEWERLKTKWEKGDFWTLEEIHYVIHSIQEYLYCDFPEKKSIEMKQLRGAFDAMTRVAAHLLYCSTNSLDDINPYTTNNLIWALRQLEPATCLVKN